MGQCDEIDGEAAIPCSSIIGEDWACLECGGKQGKTCTAKAGFGSSYLIEGKCNANFGCAKAEDEISLAGRKKRKKRKKKKKNKNKRFNCLTREKWTEEKTAWCCENEQLGCTVTDACEDKNEELAAIMMVEGYTCATALEDYESNMCENENFIPYCCQTCSMKEEPSVDCLSERPEPKCEGDTLVTFVESDTTDSRGCMIYGREEIVCGMGLCNAEAGQCDEIDGEAPIPCNSNIGVDWACMECGGKQGEACTAKAGFGSSDLIEGECNANYGCAKVDEISLAARKKRKKRKGKKKRKNKNKGEESEDSEEDPGFNCLTREKWTEEKTAWCCENEQLGCTVTEPCAEATMKDGTCCNWANARFDYSDLENVPDHPEECCEGEVTMNNECPAPALPECTCPSYQTGAILGTEMCQFGDNCALGSNFDSCPPNAVHCVLTRTTEEPSEGYSGTYSVL